MPVGLDFLRVTKIIAGTGVERRSHERQLDKQYAHVAASLKTFISHGPELPANTPLPGRPLSKPDLSTDLASQRSLPRQRNLNTTVPQLEQELSPPSIPWTTCMSPLGPPDISATEHNEDFLRRNYSYDDIIQRDGKAKYFASNGMPYITALKGFGRYRMAVHADAEHQLSVLHRSMSCLDAKFIKQCNLDMSGFDTAIVDKYKAMRLEREPSDSSRSDSVSDPCYITLDEVRGCLIIRGFSASSSASSAASSFRNKVRHLQKDSSCSSVDSSDSYRIRHKSRQASLHISGASDTSPLTTIAEGPEQWRKVQRQCVFENGNTDSALASDASESDGEWQDVDDFSMPVRRTSQLSQQVAKSRRQSGDGKMLLRARTKSIEHLKPGQGKGLDRNKTIKPTQRPAIKRANSKNAGAKKWELQSAPDMATGCQPRPIPQHRGQSSQSVEQAWSQKFG